MQIYIYKIYTMNTIRYRITYFVQIPFINPSYTKRKTDGNKNKKKREREREREIYPGARKS